MIISRKPSQFKVDMLILPRWIFHPSSISRSLKVFCLAPECFLRSVWKPKQSRAESELLNLLSQQKLFLPLTHKGGWQKPSEISTHSCFLILLVHIITRFFPYFWLDGCCFSAAISESHLLQLEKRCWKWSRQIPLAVVAVMLISMGKQTRNFILGDFGCWAFYASLTSCRYGSGRSAVVGKPT